MTKEFEKFKKQLCKEVTKTKRSDRMDAILRKVQCFNWNNFVRQ